MSVFMNRLRNRVSQVTYRPRRSPSPPGDKKESGASKHRPKSLFDRLEGHFMEEEREPKTDGLAPKD